jgi:hypothetical protein
MNTIKSALKQSKFLQQSESLNFQVAEDQLGQRRVSFQSGRPPVHKEGARLRARNLLAGARASSI